MRLFDRDHLEAGMRFDLLLEGARARRRDAFVHAAGDDGDLGAGVILRSPSAIALPPIAPSAGESSPTNAV